MKYKKHSLLFLFKPDGVPGGGAETPPAETPGETNGNGLEPLSDKAANPTPGATEGKIADLPDWAQKLVHELRQEAGGHRKAKREAEEARAAAEEARLVEEKKWQELADKRGTELDSVKGKAEKADKLSELISAQIEAEIKAWPAEVRDLLFAEGDDVLVKLERLDKGRALVAKMNARNTPGNAPGPKGSDEVTSPPVAEPIFSGKQRF